MSFAIKSTAMALVGLMVLTSMMVASPELAGDTVDPGNGGQDVCSDTERDLVYYIEPVYYKFQACGWDNNVAYEIQLGHWGVRAMDISADGSKVYVTAEGGSSITVIDLEVQDVVDTFFLTFVPNSISCADGNIAYVSCLNDNSVRCLDMDDGSVIWTEDVGLSGIVECGPGGDELLVFGALTSGVKVLRYDVSGSPSFEAESNDALGEVFVQAAVDWTGGDLYIITDRNSVQKLTLGTLDRVVELPLSGSPIGLMINIDRSMLMCISYVDWSTNELTLFDESTGAIETSCLVPAASASAMSEDMTTIMQFTLQGFGAYYMLGHADPSAPRSGSVIGFTPEYVSFFLYSNLYPIDNSTVSVTMTGPEGGVSLIKKVYSDFFKMELSTQLQDGQYDVNVTWIEDEEVRWQTWSFTIDRDDPSAERPSIFPSTPAPDETVLETPDVIQVIFERAVSMPLDREFVIEMDGAPLDFDGNYDDIWLTAAPTENILPGTHYVNASLTWDGGASYANWSFVVAKEVSISNTTIGPMDELNAAPKNIEIEVDLGYPASEILGATIAIDDREYDADIVGSNLLRVEIPDDQWNYTDDIFDNYHYTNDYHFICVDIETDQGITHDEWQFYISVQAPVYDMDLFRCNDTFGIPVPKGWTITENGTLGSQIYDLVCYTDLYEHFAQVYIMNGRDTTIDEDDEYLEDMVDEIISGFSYEVDLIGEPQYTELAGHKAVIFTMSYGSSISIMHKCAIIVSERSDEFWVINCITYPGYYEEMDPTFNSMIGGFEVYKEQEPITTANDLIIYVAIVAGVALVGVVGILLVLKKRRG